MPWAWACAWHWRWRWPRLLTNTWILAGLVRPVVVEGDSMTPALAAGKRVLVDRSFTVWRAPRRWELVALDCPITPGEWCVKRVVGLPGESVELRDEGVWIDGRPAELPPEIREVYYVKPGPPGSTAEWTLGRDEYFLLGDNSRSSQDSRTWPQPGIGLSQIVGRVIHW